jgi:tellurium resistance protein TerZ
VWFGQLRSADGSVVHTGDNLTGAGEGDDESIIVDLAALPANVTALLFTVNRLTQRATDGEGQPGRDRVVDDRYRGDDVRAHGPGLGARRPGSSLTLRRRLL